MMSMIRAAASLRRVSDPPRGYRTAHVSVAHVGPGVVSARWLKIVNDFRHLEDLSRMGFRGAGGGSRAPVVGPATSGTDSR